MLYVFVLTVGILRLCVSNHQTERADATSRGVSTASGPSFHHRVVRSALHHYSLANKLVCMSSQDGQKFDKLVCFLSLSLLSTLCKVGPPSAVLPF